MSTHQQFLTHLTGTWRVSAILAHASYPSPSSPKPSTPPCQCFSTSPQGSLQYSPDGYMSAVMQSGTASNYAQWNLPTTEECERVVRETQCYAGKFFVDEGSVAVEHKDGGKGDGEKEEVWRAVVWHEPFAALPPNWRGPAQKRNAELTIATDGKGGEKRTLVMKVERSISLGVWLIEDQSEKFLEVRFERAEDNSGGQRQSGL